MKYIVYCTRNNKNSKIYIGVHQTINPFNFDGYLGCGIYTHSKTIKGTTAFQNAVKKYGPENFTRITLAIFDTEADAYDLEEKLVNKEFVRRQDTYNMIPGGVGAGYINPNRAVRQLDTSGELINTFDTLREAANSVGEDYLDIGKACTTPNFTLKGFYWRYTNPYGTELHDINHIVHAKTKELAVVQYSKAGYKMKTWDSIQTAALALKCDKSSISSSCKGEHARKICGGYQWRYASDNLDKIDPANTVGGPPRKIMRLTPDDVLVEIYESITDAETKFGLSKVSIHKALKRNKISGGFRWQYV